MPSPAARATSRPRSPDAFDCKWLYRGISTLGVSLRPQDVLVIGGGPGGYVAAIKAAQLGLKVSRQRALMLHHALAESR